MIDKIIYNFFASIDKFFAIIEDCSSKINVWVWNKRWRNRNGTGYKYAKKNKKSN